MASNITFGKTKTYKKHGTKFIPITDHSGDEVLLTIRDCFTYGSQVSVFEEKACIVSKTEPKSQLPLVLESQTEFRKELSKICDSCTEHLGLRKGTKVVSGMYEKDDTTTFYAKFDEDVDIYNEVDPESQLSDEDIGKGKVSVSIKVGSIFVNEAGKAYVRLRIVEVKILKKPKPKRKRML